MYMLNRLRKSFTIDSDAIDNVGRTNYYYLFLTGRA